MIKKIKIGFIFLSCFFIVLIHTSSFLIKRIKMETLRGMMRGLGENPHPALGHQAEETADPALAHQIGCIILI